MTAFARCVPLLAALYAVDGAFIAPRISSARRIPPSSLPTLAVIPSPVESAAHSLRPAARALRSSSAPSDAARELRQPQRRFDRTASNVTSVEEPCLLTIGGATYNLTGWANAHPGGAAALRRYQHNLVDGALSPRPDATAAFEAAGHSDHARRLLESFRIDGGPVVSEGSPRIERGWGTFLSRWRIKLVTREDPIGLHKVLGVYALLHFAYRNFLMILGPDPSAGLGGNLGKGASLWGLFCLAPHLLLSLSSLIFHTVPKERVVGKPMIWKENRMHSILFGTRSILCSALAWASVRAGHTPGWRKAAVWGSSACVFATMAGADLATARLGPGKADSSVATLPFWEGCSARTQRLVKTFYASTQFMATSTCLAAANPAWPLLMLFPIQFASFLLTLSRKGLIGGLGWHVGYAGSLVFPFFVAIRTAVHLGSPAFVTGLLGTSLLLFGLRCTGINKYALWVPVIATRIAIGDNFIPYDVW